MRLPKRISSAPSPLMVAMREAIKAGLEIWQVRAPSCLPHASHAWPACLPRCTFWFAELFRIRCIALGVRNPS